MKKHGHSGLVVAKRLPVTMETTQENQTVALLVPIKVPAAIMCLEFPVWSGPWWSGMNPHP